MAAIPEEIVERVKVETNIVDVVSDYVRLRRSGKNWLGLCPFHDDKNPSMAVEPERGIFKCFACGKGGNVFTFLMDLNGWNFPETVRTLAERLGVEIPEDQKDREEYSERERLYAAVRDAGRYYYRTLYSEAGESALAYLRKRGFTDETITKFGLGFSLEEWDGLLNHLTDKGYTGQELVKAGLAKKREKGDGVYDRFRGRTMFPIFTATGRVIGFGARRMNEDPEQPKYINSPDSEVYHKSRVLYGLYQAKDAIRKSGIALFVEGYTDVISLHQAGIANAIATSGTAMAPEHADLIQRYTSHVVLVFDSDMAGQGATERGIDVLLRKGIDVSVLRLPDGEDPDTFVRKYGVKEFEQRIVNSHSFLEFRARVFRSAGDFESPERATAAIRSLVQTIALIPDQLKRELFVQKLAADYHLSENVLVKELERALGTKKGGVRQRNMLPQPYGAQPANGRGVTPPHAAEAGAMRAIVANNIHDTIPTDEIGLLKVLVAGDTQMLEHVFERIDLDDFSHPLTRQLVGHILRHYVEQKPITVDKLVMEELEANVRDLVTYLAVERETISDYWWKNDPEFAWPNPWKIARDCLIRMEQGRIEREYRHVQEKLKQEALTEDDEEQILQKIKELSQRKEALASLLNA